MHLLSQALSSGQLLSHVQLFVTPWTAGRQASLSINSPWSLLILMSIESVMPSKHLILCHPLLLPPSIFPASGSFQMSQFLASSGQRIGVSALASVLPMNSQDWFPLGWLDLLAFQGTLKSLLQYHSSKASILRCSAFCILSFIYLPAFVSRERQIKLYTWRINRTLGQLAWEYIHFRKNTIFCLG